MGMWTSLGKTLTPVLVATSLIKKMAKYVVPSFVFCEILFAAFASWRVKVPRLLGEEY